MAPEKKDWLLDERLLQSQKLAAIGELSAGIAHEINNPLAIIRQEAEWMQHLLKKLGGDGHKELAELQGSVRQIVQQVDRCTEITRNLLDFARKRDPVIQAVEVNRIIENMTMLVEKEAKHNNITIVRHYDADLAGDLQRRSPIAPGNPQFSYQCHASHHGQRRRHHHHT